MVPIPTPIYHITHIDNLKKILSSGALLANCKLHTEYTNIAYNSLQERRERIVIPYGPGGNLHDYVPFFFCTRPPMLFKIKNGPVNGYTQGQEPIVYLVSIAQKVEEKDLQFVFTDGHGIMDFTDFYENLNDLDKVDWDIMQARYWADTLEDNDRSRRRQAEFLVYRSLPWDFINEIGVFNDKIKAQVRGLLTKVSHCPSIKIRHGWYY